MASAQLLSLLEEASATRVGKTTLESHHDGMGRCFIPRSSVHPQNEDQLQPYNPNFIKQSYNIP